MEVVYPLEIVKDFAAQIGMKGSVEDFYNSIPLQKNARHREQIISRTCMTALALIRSGYDLKKKVKDTRLSGAFELTLKETVMSYTQTAFQKGGPGFLVDLKLTSLLLEKLAGKKNPWELFIMAATGIFGSNTTLWGQFESLCRGVKYDEVVVMPDDVEIWDKMPIKPDHFVFTGYPIHAHLSDPEEDIFSITLRTFSSIGVADFSVFAPAKLVKQFNQHICPDIYNKGPIRGRRINIVAESGKPFYKYRYVGWYPAGRLTGPEVAKVIDVRPTSTHKNDGYNLGEIRYDKVAGSNWVLGIGYWGGLAVPAEMTKEYGQSHTEGGPKIYTYIRTKDSSIVIQLNVQHFFQQPFIVNDFHYHSSEVGTVKEKLKGLTHVEVTTRKINRWLSEQLPAKYLDSVKSRIKAKAQEGRISVWQAIWLIGSEQKGASHPDKQKLAEIAGNAAFRNWD